MIGTLLCTLWGVVVRLAVVSLLIKSSLDIIAINNHTPRLIVERSRYFFDVFQNQLGLSFD